MADVCNKHNVKLLTYGTLVRLQYCRRASNGNSRADHIYSAVVSWPTNGSGSTNPIRIKIQ